MVCPLHLVLSITTMLCQLGNMKLIEKCSLPWIPYIINSASLGKYKIKYCQDKCSGRAFHNNEGKLICFRDKDVSQRKPQMGPSVHFNDITCECGYFTKSIRREWISCNTSIITSTIEVCNEYCGGITVYYYKRGHCKDISYCEQSARNKFYNLAGGIEVFFNHSDNGVLTHRICTCGIRNLELKQLFDEKTFTSVQAFLECSDPWEPLDLKHISTYQLCVTHCRDVCKRGAGFPHKGKSFCFSRSTQAKKRSIFHGGTPGLCECGYVKHRSSSYHYIPCDPPITKQILKSAQCSKFCSESMVYLHRKKHQVVNVRCIRKPDIKKLKPAPLLEKCDAEVYTNDTVKFMKCSCGLGGFSGENKSIKSEDDDIKLPDAWIIKKKRTLRAYEKLYKIDRLINY